MISVEYVGIGEPPLDTGARIREVRGLYRDAQAHEVRFRSGQSLNEILRALLTHTSYVMMRNGHTTIGAIIPPCKPRNGQLSTQESDIVRRAQEFVYYQALLKFLQNGTIQLSDLKYMTGGWIGSKEELIALLDNLRNGSGQITGHKHLLTDRSNGRTTDNTGTRMSIEGYGTVQTPHEWRIPQDSRHIKAHRADRMIPIMTGAGVTMVLASSCSPIELPKTVTQTPVPTTTPTAEPAPTHVPFPETINPNGQQEISAGDNIHPVVTVDSYGIPISYRMPDGTTVPFDRQYLKEQYDQAKQSGETELVQIIPIGLIERKPIDLGSEEKPVTTEMPSDVVTQEELVSRGITIIQPEGCEFFIRRGAFDRGGLLEEYGIGGKKKLVIAFTDTATVNEEAVRDPKYKGIWKLFSKTDPPLPDIGQDPSTIRTFRVTSEQITVREMQAKLQEARMRNEPQAKINELLNLVKNAKGDLYMWEHVYSDSDILTIVKNSGMNGGQYWDEEDVQNKLGWQDTAVIVVSTRNGYGYYYTNISVDPYGHFNVDHSIDIFGGDGEINPSDTYPNPEEFQFDPSASEKNKKYAIHGGSLGFVIRHEIYHHLLTNSKGKDASYNEYLTDMGAFSTIEEAFRRWKETGDNSGYYFVFKLKDGTYILTRYMDELGRKTNM